MKAYQQGEELEMSTPKDLFPDPARSCLPSIAILMALSIETILKVLYFSKANTDDFSALWAANAKICWLVSCRFLSSPRSCIWCWWRTPWNGSGHKRNNPNHYLATYTHLGLGTPASDVLLPWINQSSCSLCRPLRKSMEMPFSSGRPLRCTLP